MFASHRLGISPRAFLSLARFLAAYSRKILREWRKSFFERVLPFFRWETVSDPGLIAVR